MAGWRHYFWEGYEAYHNAQSQHVQASSIIEDTMKRFIVKLWLSRHHRHLGTHVVTHPYYFFIIPILLSVALSAGILFIETERDYEVLCSPQNSRAYKEREMIESIFPMNSSSNFDFIKITRSVNFVSVIAFPKDGGSILRSQIFSEIVELDRIIQNLTVVVNGGLWNYSTLCAKAEGQCVENVALALESDLKRFQQGKFRFKFPFHIDKITFKVTPYAMNLGGVSTNHEGYVEDSKAIRLLYYFDNSNRDVERVGAEWEANVRNMVEQTVFQSIKVKVFSYLSVKHEVRKYTSESIHFLGVAVVLMVGFSALSCMTNNWIRSKPWLGFAACVSVGLAVASAFGIAGYCGIKYADVVIALPFLMIGLGMDDSFVLLSAWRRTDTSGTVEERFSEAYSEAATSITITSLTDLLSFCLGIAAPFPIVQIFCSYAAIAVMFTYLYQISFFGSCVALSGFREHRHLHPFTFAPITSKGIPAEDYSNEKSKGDAIMLLFRNGLGRYLTMPSVKAALVILALSSLGVAVWGCLTIEEGLDVKDVFHPASNSLSFIELNYKYFSEFSARLHVVINKTLNYADEEVQQKIENITRRLESHPSIASGLLTESWLRFYLLMAQQPIGKYVLGSFNLSNKQDFIDGLDNVFFKFPQTRRLRNNVIFNENKTEIVASRIFFTCKGLTEKDSRRNLLQYVRKLVGESDIPMLTHSLYFLFDEQMLAVRTIFLQTVGIAAAVTFIIFFIFIPNVKCALSVALIMVAIEVQAIGYMSFWGVNLDILSMINLVMCVGYSINYPAHFGYAYVVSPKNIDSNEKIKMALYAASVPILQSSFTTILGLTVLAFVPSYTLLVFLKTIFLIVTFTCLYAVFVLPIVLSACDNCCRNKNGKSVKESASFKKIENDNE